MPIKRSTIGVFLLLVLGALAIGVWKFLAPRFFAKGQVATSDAAKIQGKIAGAGDNYIGYEFIRSSEMKRALAQQGFLLEWTDDGGAYAERLQKFAEGRYDFIVLPINSYLTHGAAHKFPGVITAAISESKGADAIVGYTDRVTATNGHEVKINSLNNANLRIAFTPDSPSSFLLSIPVVHFGLEQLRYSGPWRIEAQGSKDALEKLQKKLVDVAILWEPDVSRALEINGVKVIFSSEQVRGLIIDVIVFSREAIRKRPELVKMFHRDYFRAIQIYTNDRPRMLKEFAKSAGLGEKAIENILNKIDYADLAENALQWFNLSSSGVVGDEQIINSIRSITDIMIRNGELSTDPLENNPFLITNRDFVAELYQSGGLASLGAPPTAPKDFAALSEGQWKALREIGTMAIRPITFQQSTGMLALAGKLEVDAAAQALINNYPQYRVLIKGHTSRGYDAEADLKLSQERAEAVKKYLEVVHGIDSDRLRALGLGSAEPLPRLPNESERAYQYRLPRVEFVLVEENAI
jgi:outer membrane protein OmpA-like peptidoglycan-associated protein/ABC-type nitrate/sulfonate/bicarbonate transport system substrate-binding protein